MRPIMLAVLIVLSARAWSEQAVDPKLVGSWRSSLSVNGDEWNLLFAVAANGAYRTTFTGAAAVPDETGTFAAAAGKWKVNKASGDTDEGTYVLAGDSLTLTGKGGTLTWTRVKQTTARPDQQNRNEPGDQALDAKQFPALDIAGTSAAKAGKSDEAYLDGLDRLQAGKFEEAAAIFTAALSKDDENPDLHTALGVTLLAREKIKEAGSELQRSLRLRQEHRETKLWLACAIAMSGSRADTNVFPAMTNDAYESRARAISHDYGNPAYYRAQGDADDAELESLKAAALAQLPAVVATFASRAKAEGGERMVELLLDRANKHIAAGRYPEALVDAEQVLSARPDDLDVLFVHASAVLGVGDGSTAREEFSRVAAVYPDVPRLFVRRALAQAMIGNAERARRDFAFGTSLKPTRADFVMGKDEVASWKAAIDREIASAPTAKLDECKQALQQALASRPWNDIVDAAIALQKVMNAQRRHCDERYADRVAQLTAAVDAEPKNADRLSALAMYLYLQGRVRTVWDGVRCEPRQIRRQRLVDYKRERALAEEYADSALAIDPRHDEALGTKAWLRFIADDKDGSYQVIDFALACNPLNARVLKLKSIYDGAASSVLMNEANQLREYKSWSNIESGAYGKTVEVHYSRPPTAEELALADEKERQSDALLNESVEALNRAISAKGDTADGWNLQAEYQRWARNNKAALDCFIRALKLDPENQTAHEGIADLYQSLGKPDLAFEHELLTINLADTTAAPLLEQAWSAICRTAFTTARTLLSRAQELDPADARVPAWLGVIATSDKDTALATTCFRHALALEEARLALLGKRPGTAYSRKLTASDVGLAMTLRVRLADLALAAGKKDESLQLSQSNLSLEPSLIRNEWPEPAANALLPDPSFGEEVPMPETVVGLLAWSRIAAGRALSALGKVDEAAKEFMCVEEYRRGLINGRGADSLESQCQYAKVALGKLGKGDRAEVIKLIANRRNQATNFQKQIDDLEAKRQAELAANDRKRDEVLRNPRAGAVQLRPINDERKEIIERYAKLQKELERKHDEEENQPAQPIDPDVRRRMRR